MKKRKNKILSGINEPRSRMAYSLLQVKANLPVEACYSSVFQG